MEINVLSNFLVSIMDNAAMLKTYDFPGGINSFLSLRFHFKYNSRKIYNIVF